MTIFTIEELGEYEVSQLRNLAKYFDVQFRSNESKGRMIEKIHRKLEELDRKDAVDNPPASVRIRRIRESQKEK
jgi:hypothetical protein